MHESQCQECLRPTGRTGGDRCTRDDRRGGHDQQQQRGTAQSQATLLGGLVSSTVIKCDAYNATNTLVDSYTYSGTSATMVNTRKNGSYGLSPSYTICITLTRSLYTGGTTTQTKCA